MSPSRSVPVLARRIRQYVRGGNPPHPELADAIRDLGLAAWELPTQFDEPWRSGDVLRLALRAAGAATAAAERDPSLAVNDIAGQVRSIAIDIVRASEAGETDHSATHRGAHRGAAGRAAAARFGTGDRVDREDQSRQA